MTADFPYFCTDIRTIPLAIFWNGIGLSQHDFHSPAHIGNIV